MTDVVTRNRNRALLSTTSGSSAKVTYIVIYTYDSAVTVAAETVRSTFITQLSTAIDDGSFVSSLQSEAAAVFTSSLTTSSSDLSVGEVTVVVVVRPVPTQSPTTTPKSDDSTVMDSPAALGGIIAGSVIAIFVIGFFIGQAWAHKKDKKIQRYADRSDLYVNPGNSMHAGKIFPIASDELMDDFGNIAVSVDEIGIVRTKPKNKTPTRQSSPGRGGLTEYYDGGRSRKILFLVASDMTPTIEQHDATAGEGKGIVIGMDDEHDESVHHMSDEDDHPDTNDKPEYLSHDLVNPPRHNSFYL